ncbi:hypothetical protein FOZ63_021016 [Perkinsus olseni]|uniref:Uncharacterized protein n=1 Tax=Perkinsus olseni TaxID=32597 RepID=A0A7J6PWQ1_PEROL|nr:hypothetical protein FOZ63_021016 [Perkinsus olseni]
MSTKPVITAAAFAIALATRAYAGGFPPLAEIDLCPYTKGPDCYFGLRSTNLSSPMIGLGDKSILSVTIATTLQYGVPPEVFFVICPKTERYDTYQCTDPSLCGGPDHVNLLKSIDSADLRERLRSLHSVGEGLDLSKDRPPYTEREISLMGERGKDAINKAKGVCRSMLELIMKEYQTWDNLCYNFRKISWETNISGESFFDV